MTGMAAAMAQRRARPPQADPPVAARPSVDPALATMAELDRQIAARAAELETEAGGDRVKYLRLLRTDGALDCLKLEHDIHRELPAARRQNCRRPFLPTSTTPS